EDYRGPFTVAGGSDAELGRAREMPVPTMTVPAGARAEFDVVFELYGLRSDRLGAAFDALPPAPAAAVAVVIGGGKASDPPPDPFLPASVDRRAYAAAVLEMQIRHRTRWALASPDGLVLISGNAGHRVQVDAPELTVEAVRHVVSRARGR